MPFQINYTRTTQLDYQNLWFIYANAVNATFILIVYIDVHNHYFNENLTTKMKRILLIIALIATAVGSAFAQIKLGDNPGNLNANALLELESSSKGLLLPRMTTAQQNLIAAPDGMMIFNTDSTCIIIRRSGVWRSLCAEGNGQPWSTTGNSNTDPTNNFVGTKDAQSLVFRTNNAEVMRMLTNGNIGIGTTTPTNKLHIVAATNPLRLQGLQSGASTDSVMTVDGTGVVRMMKMTDVGANAFTANNGLTKAGSLVQLGGALIIPTTITTTATNTFAIAGLQGGTGVDSVVVADAATGVLRRMKMSDIGANAIGVTNGLTKAGNIISLGGALTTPTTLATTATNVLNITGLQTSATTDSVVTIDGATGQLRRTTMAIIGANSFTADNGLTKLGSNVKLGGPLTAATSIATTATNTISFTGLQGGLSTDSVMTITNAGVVQRMSMSSIGANSIGVTNGLTKAGNIISLGGALTVPTTLATTATNVLNITGLQTSATTDSVVTIDGTTGQLRRTTMAIIGANSFTADNGLTKLGSNVKLGGPLTAATSIATTATNTISFTGLQGGLSTDSVMTITNAGVVQRMSMSALGANSITVSNGLTKTGNNIVLGGTLTGATTLTTSATNTLSLAGLQSGASTDSIVTINNATGVLRRVSINALAAAAPDFWLDGNGVRPDGTTDNTERVYRTGDVGIGSSAAPTSKFQVTGSVSMSITTTTSALTLDATHYTVIANCTAGAIALTLPAATTCTGRIYNITKSDETTNALSFSIPLKLTETTNVSSYNFTKRLRIQSDGTNWRVISE
jgi:hypothetical protein